MPYLIYESARWREYFDQKVEATVNTCILTQGLDVTNTVRYVSLKLQDAIEQRLKNK